MKSTRTVVVAGVGVLAALGIAGTALAATRGESPARVAAALAETPSATPSDTTSPAPSASTPSGGATSSGSADPAAPAGATVDANGAREIALRAVPGGQVHEVELDDDDNDRQVWDVDVHVGDVEHEIEIDPASGKVVQHETGDRDDDRGDDNDDD
ncbi:PepSY domain-containing protein [Paractinoplanes atraurantiacus]|uniref:Peptidase propeptide and YPEB domain-containing protein n=1 Tax=Paractinoplanes atraurantiacus TaxID=1036182 RepID=A0A285KMN6_9ACTN|nr:PepSY domain-containing protein [Actinoplanes atraurantiacus]SNY73902.1 Peptidase propeptide and YPEB domain-containing protein [Actinoplanes atraurantiacus]